MKKEFRLPLTDARLAEETGLSKVRVGNYRREMQKLPSQSRHLANGGKMIYLDGFNAYLVYRLTDDWHREMAMFTKMKNSLKKKA